MNTPLLKGNDIAKILNISRSQAFVLMKSGELPTIRFGRCVRVRQEDLDAFIENNLCNNLEFDLKAKPAAATASLETNQVNPLQKEVTHER